MGAYKHTTGIAIQLTDLIVTQPSRGATITVYQIHFLIPYHTIGDVKSSTQVASQIHPQIPGIVTKGWSHMSRWLRWELLYPN